ncbi:tripartite tricarboxylate transporter TctB family protein [Desulfosediminicola flagellatus]|uniref:tripartite tricarboxylate transporter TctB family protein n=1 Tax=Desulfosediminicola flagellatus TaxID=2569541 RepID=UPI00142F08EB|nr:tripartite tricarboxylate transporter TctB family protein [Desulfosediminicola flagellatus]
MENRISGMLVSLFGIVVLFFVIPSQTEVVDYGWLKPATLPSIAAVIITLSGVLHSVFPKGAVEFEPASALRALLFLFIGALGVWLMTFNYLIAAPMLMLVLMRVVGERRWGWLFIGVVLLPAFIWFCVDYLLQRPLP